MEPKFQTSFIPKKPIMSADGSSGISVVRTTNIFSIIATVVFIMTVLVAGALFLYKTTIEGQIEAAKQEVEQAKESYGPEIIQKLIDASTKIQTANELLEQHVVVSEVMKELERLTVRRLRFDDFLYKKVNGVPTLTMKGEVQNYNALAQQQEIFNNSTYMKNPEFAGFNLQENGFINVNFSAELDPSIVSYRRLVDPLPLNQ